MPPKMVAKVIDSQQRLLRFLAKNWQHSMRAIVITSVALAFTYNVYSNFSIYQQCHNIVETKESSDLPARFPPVIICPFPPYDPFKLISLGLNVAVDTSTELQYNVHNLIGINRSLTGKELVEEAAWKVEDFVKEVRIGEFIKESYTEGGTPSPLWHRSFTSVGPCWTFNSPSAASLHSLQLSIKLQEMFLSLKPCFPGYESNLKQEVINSISCKDSDKWEYYLQNTLLLMSPYLPSTYSSYDLYSTKEEQKIDFHTYELLPYEILSDFPDDGNYNAYNCLHMNFFRYGTGICGLHSHISKYSEKIHRIPLYYLQAEW